MISLEMSVWFDYICIEYIANFRINRNSIHKVMSVRNARNVSQL